MDLAMASKDRLKIVVAISQRIFYGVLVTKTTNQPTPTQ
jgi:hypothetical protein